MAVLNYTTEVAAEKSAQQIRIFLRKWKAEEVSESYDTHGNISGMGFVMSGIPYRLLCDYQGVYQRMRADADVPRRYTNEEQARRVAWRMLLGWIKYQIEVVESGLFRKEAVLMPYRLTSSGETAWEVYKVKMLPGGANGT